LTRDIASIQSRDLEMRTLIKRPMAVMMFGFDWVLDLRKISHHHNPICTAQFQLVAQRERPTNTHDDEDCRNLFVRGPDATRGDGLSVADDGIENIPGQNIDFHDGVT
jgi:hypothetical protein